MEACRLINLDGDDLFLDERGRLHVVSIEPAATTLTNFRSLERSTLRAAFAGEL